MANKKLTDVTQASSFALTDNMFINQGNSAKQVKGQVVNDAIVANAVVKAKEEISPIATDGVYIMYHRKSDNNVVTARPEQWTVLQNSGEIADGVLISQGGRNLVVAPTDSGSGMKWSSSTVLVGTAVNNRLEALQDFDGKSKTAAILADATIGADGDGYAPGFCAAYSRVNSNGQGLTAGKWWLPSLGESMFIFANKNKINHCLKLISGATEIFEGGHVGSTEKSSSHYWYMNLSTGYIVYNVFKNNSSHRVRPVSAFIA